MEKSKAFFRNFETQIGIRSKAEKRWFRTAFVLLLIYVEFIIYAQNTALGYAGSPPLNVFFAVAAIPLCFLGLLAVSRLKISENDRCMKNRLTPRRQLLFTTGVWIFTFCIFFLCQRAYWPGAFGADNIGQYTQMRSGVYNNWHPVLHTWLFYWIPFHIFHRTAGIVLTQILWFSLAITYLFFVLYTSGCPKGFLVCGWLYIVANPNTLHIMMFPLKDSALTIFSTVLFTQLIRIYLTEGTWLKKWYNLALFSLFAFLAEEMRHNAVLLVVPIFILLFCFFKSVRKRVIISAALVILAYLLLHGPVFALVHVTPSLNNEVTETVGFPMTILSDIYVQDREALGEEAQSFMDSYASQEAWKNYKLGNFNSIKWYGNPASCQEIGRKKILQYTMDAARKRPDLAWNAFCTLTRLVWGFDISNNDNRVDCVIADNTYGIKYYGNEQLQIAFSTYSKYVTLSVTKYMFAYIGCVILILLFLATGKLGNGNLIRVFPALIPMVYNFGTMLLLSGPSFRFFHFNFVIVVPLVYLMLKGKNTSASGSVPI